VALNTEVAKRALAVVDQMDARGAWVEDGRLRYHGDDDDTRHVIESRTFIRNLVALARFVGAKP
jgi:type IV secretory pathway VirD2 relaxase